MNKIKNNQSGFSAVELLLILLVIAILGGVGWLFYKHYKKAPATTTTSTTKPAESTPASATVDPTASWTAFSSKTGKFSMKYPSSWGKLTCDDDSVVFLGSSANAVGKCYTDFGGQMFTSSSAGDQRSDYELASNNYDNIVKSDVTIDGVTGKKESGTFKAPGEAGIGPADGTKAVQYIFYTSGRTYVAQYNQIDDFTDVLNDFNLMVTKTLKFTP